MLYRLIFSLSVVCLRLSRRAACAWLPPVCWSAPNEKFILDEDAPTVSVVAGNLHRFFFNGKPDIQTC